MAAGKQRKRLTNSSLHEHQKEKKKKRLDSSDFILSLRSHVYLQWDGGQGRVVAKKEQIGITWKHMSPYVDFTPKFQSGLADVISFPKEIFDLDNLMGVLSHEAWLTCLSESERKLLMLFLPGCASAEQTILSLLNGENLHFGNPLLKWSTLLCSSDLHPDALLLKERQIRIRKKNFYLELNNYHNDMVAVLKILKEKSENCEDPEKLWSRVSSEKHNGFLKQRKDPPVKMCNRYGGVTKYMAYIKVSKQQLQMIKELKHSGDGIQLKSLSHVLGNIKKLHMYSYESYEDEEKIHDNLLREHWMQVAKDTHAAFEEFSNRKLLKVQQMKCLQKELSELVLESNFGNLHKDRLNSDSINKLNFCQKIKELKTLISPLKNQRASINLRNLSCHTSRETYLNTEAASQLLSSYGRSHDEQFLIPTLNDLNELSYPSRIGYEDQMKYRQPSNLLQTRLTEDQRPLIDWPGIESSQSGGESCGLFGGLPGHADLVCRPSFEASGPQELLLQARNYIDTPPGAASMAPSMDVMWMNYSHQSSGLQEPFSKPFMRRWHQ